MEKYFRISKTKDFTVKGFVQLKAKSQKIITGFKIYLVGHQKNLKALISRELSVFNKYFFIYDQFLSRSKSRYFFALLL